jgi:methionine-rich copper-binding protein CopC
MRRVLPVVALALAVAFPAVAQAAVACCCCAKDGQAAQAAQSAPADHAGHAGHSGHAAHAAHAADGVVTSPADGAMTDGSPDWFHATFPHAMTLKSVTVTAAGQAAVTVPVAAAAATTRVSADLPTLAPGNYVLNWTAEGADGHEMTGAVRFMVH